MDSGGSKPPGQIDSRDLYVKKIAIELINWII